MAKRNNRIDTDVIALAVTGLSQRAIAEKLSLSQATVSKILQDNKNNQKLSKGEEIMNYLIKDNDMDLIPGKVYDVVKEKYCAMWL